MALGVGTWTWLDVLVGINAPPTYRIGGLEHFGPIEKKNGPKGEPYIGEPTDRFEGSGRWVRGDPGLKCIEDAYKRQHMICLAPMATATDGEMMQGRVTRLNRDRRKGTYELTLVPLGEWGEGDEL